MNIEEYFGMIITILIGLTFIAIILAFVFMVYGDNEEGKTQIKNNTINTISQKFFSYMFNLFII
jgi:hypothetical protein